ncbi:MAG: hypothetical protein R6U29_13355 [Desulfosudaceae bacterium]
MTTKEDDGLHTNRHLHIFRNTPFGKETLLPAGPELGNNHWHRLIP